jgi:hypothetical protein
MLETGFVVMGLESRLWIRIRKDPEPDLEFVFRILVRDGDCVICKYNETIIKIGTGVNRKW